MKTVAITQRVAVIREYDERRDCLDQAWPRFLEACGLLPLPLPNVPEIALAMCEKFAVTGLVLTGGNDLAASGGDAPERDVTENRLLDAAESRKLPVLAVCRGMQLVQHRAGVTLERVSGHVTRAQEILIDGAAREVNSYHCFGARETPSPLESWAIASDGVVKAVRHTAAPITAIMWHPERRTPFDARDIALFQSVFKAQA